MRVHFIAIGGAAMHSLAIALKKKGFEVSGSDDEIFDPSKSRLEKYNILPEKWGWFPEKIDKNIDAVILGMHARGDNAELLKAKELGIKIFSFPEYLYEQCKNKKRVVIAGSHGKTTTTAMVLHVLKHNGIKFDYMAGAALEGFETMVGLSDEAEIAVFEGDEYLTSPIDLRPKFLLYQPHISLVTGIAWDHANVFPTFENYVEQFRTFLQQHNNEASVIYFEKDAELKKIIEKLNCKTLSYNTHPYFNSNNCTFLETEYGSLPLKIFGEHNLQNLNGARKVCNLLGVTNKNFYDAISSFSGATKRLQLLAANNNCNIFLDFAHSPSKLQATINAVKQQFPTRKLLACMELHTFSSLNKNFLPQYENTMNMADRAVVFFNPATLEHKKLPPLSKNDILETFKMKNLEVINQKDIFVEYLKNFDKNNTTILLMSSGNFSGVDFQKLSEELI